MKEMGPLEERGIPVRERLFLSEACPLILPYHIALDQAREIARGKKKLLVLLVVVSVQLTKIKLLVVACVLAIYSIKPHLLRSLKKLWLTTTSSLSITTMPSL